MAIDIYREILEHAPNSTYPSAGDLHEAIWTELLRRTDPRVHNVRVTRGDGGIDGVAFLDAASGEARVYQAKFFPDLADDQGKRRGAIVDAFARAHQHPFPCTSWVLLLPKKLSHTDLGWLMGSLKPAALKVLEDKGSPADAEPRLAACAVEHKDDDDLVGLLRDHLDIAARFLPEGTMALMYELARERRGRSDDRSQIVDVLQVIREDSIRRHQVESRRARAALAVLNQGWANVTSQLQVALANEKLAPAPLRVIAAEVESLAAARTVHAYECEALAPGVSTLLAEIHSRARWVQAVSSYRDVGLTTEDAGAEVARALLEAIRRLGQLVGATQLAVRPPS